MADTYGSLGLIRPTLQACLSTPIPISPHLNLEFTISPRQGCEAHMGGTAVWGNTQTQSPYLDNSVTSCWWSGWGVGEPWTHPGLCSSLVAMVVPVILARWDAGTKQGSWSISPAARSLKGNGTHLYNHNRLSLRALSRGCANAPLRAEVFSHQEADSPQRFSQRCRRGKG